MCLPEAPVKRDLLVKKNIVKASFWAVLCHYGNVRDLNAPANEFTKVGMIELPADGERQRVKIPYLVQRVVLDEEG